MFILDTNVVLELRKAKAGKAHPGLVEWAGQTSPALMFLSVITLQELEHGVLLAERRDPTQGDLLRTWLDGSVIPAFADRVMSVDATIALEAAALHVPDPASFRDALIGATAIVNDMTVITRNTRDFERFASLATFNPWFGNP